MNKDTLMTAVLVVTGVALLGWAGASAWQTNRSAAYKPQRYIQALQDELPDQCAVPEGYTDAEWQEHMSHHPDRYQECFVTQ